MCRESLGEGAYGEAFRGFDTQSCCVGSGHQVHPERPAATRKDALEQGRALARVTDPCIVVVFDVARVVDPVTNSVLDAVVMELVDGRSLVERAANRRTRGRSSAHRQRRSLDAVDAVSLSWARSPRLARRKRDRRRSIRKGHRSHVLRDRGPEVLCDTGHTTTARGSSCTRHLGRPTPCVGRSDGRRGEVRARWVAKPTIELLRSEFRRLLQRQVPTTVTESRTRRRR